MNIKSGMMQKYSCANISGMSNGWQCGHNEDHYLLMVDLLQLVSVGEIGDLLLLEREQIMRGQIQTIVCTTTHKKAIPLSIVSMIFSWSMLNLLSIAS